MTYISNHGLVNHTLARVVLLETNFVLLLSVVYTLMWTDRLSNSMEQSVRK
jgi:hypothetical protein